MSVKKTSDQSNSTPTTSAPEKSRVGEPVMPLDQTSESANAPPAVRTDAGSSPTTETASDARVAEFIAQMKQMTPQMASQLPGRRGRLIFAMDATMSRQPTWDMALALQGQMFSAVKVVGGLDVQLVFFRGYGECRASKWVSDPDALARLMTSVTCRGGTTQIGKILSHARRENDKIKVSAMVFVGDAMEEKIDHLCGQAGELAMLGLPIFMFQEGVDSSAAQAFREIARLTKGAYCNFDAGSATQLRELLSAVAVYAAGGRQALQLLCGRGNKDAGGASVGARLLLEQLPRGS